VLLFDNKIGFVMLPNVIKSIAKLISFSTIKIMKLSLFFIFCSTPVFFSLKDLLLLSPNILMRSKPQL